MFVIVSSCNYFFVSTHDVCPQALSLFGFEDKSPTPLLVKGEKEFKIAGMHAFTSTRKRMSVIIATNDGGAIVYCKGADNIVMERLDESPERLAALRENVMSFSETGLRTLVLATRRLSAADFSAWKQRYSQATSMGSGIEKKAALADVAATVECKLKVVGVTAIDDKLQDHVPDTLKSLRSMGIRLWVLTGDKLETAVSIGFSSSTLVPSDLVVALDDSATPAASDDVELHAMVDKCFRKLHDIIAPGEDAASNKNKDGSATEKNNEPTKSPEERAAESGRILEEICAIESEFDFFRIANRPVNKTQSDADTARKETESMMSGKPIAGGVSLAIVITGRMLSVALDSGELEDLFLEVALRCTTVLACRVSPLQKAQVVGLVKEGMEPSPTTLAIGDGANDVGMLQRADVGIGIYGREGRQAVSFLFVQFILFCFFRFCWLSTV